MRSVYISIYAIFLCETYKNSSISTESKKMKQQYSLATEKFSVDKLKLHLSNRTLIPSRVMLKEQLEERFVIIKEQGIGTLKALIDALKSKDKVEAFSTATNIPVEYLTLLKREASSYVSKPVALSAFTGIQSEVVTKLHGKGIKNTKHLWSKSRSQKEIEDLAASFGIPQKEVEELVALSDLVRLYGVGPAFARIIYDTGVDSVEEFVTCTGEQFIEIYEQKTGKKADFSIHDINFSIEIGHELLQ